MKMFFSLILTLLLFLGVSGQQAIIDSLGNAYTKSVQGSVALVFIGGGEKYFYYYNDKKSIDSNAVFDLGNLTETFTSLLFASMVVEGKMNVDDHLEKYLPEGIAEPVYQPVICRPIDLPDRFENEMSIQLKPFACSPDTTVSPQGILLCDLSTHTAGFPFWPTNAGKAEVYNSNYSTKDLLIYISQYIPSVRHGFEYRPSATGTMILGYCIAKANSNEFSEVMKKELLNKLNMYSTVFLSQSEVSKAFYPYYGLSSTIKDMSEFLSLNISFGRNRMTDILNYSHNARISYGKDEIALGWKIKNLGDVSYVYASGKSIKGSSFIAFDEISHQGIVVLDSSSFNAEKLGFQILNEFKKK